MLNVCLNQWELALVFYFLLSMGNDIEMVVVDSGGSSLGHGGTVVSPKKKKNLLVLDYLFYFTCILKFQTQSLLITLGPLVKNMKLGIQTQNMIKTN